MRLGDSEPLETRSRERRGTDAEGEKEVRGQEKHRDREAERSGVNTQRIRAGSCRFARQTGVSHFLGPTIFGFLFQNIFLEAFRNG